MYIIFIGCWVLCRLYIYLLICDVKLFTEVGNVLTLILQIQRAKYDAIESGILVYGINILKRVLVR